MIGLRDGLGQEDLAMRIFVLAIAGALLVGAASVSPSPAEDAGSTLPPARYAFNRVTDGFLRLDNRTGQIAHCSPQSGVGWVCQAVPEDRAALEQEIGRLQEKVKSLQQQLAALRPPAPPPRPPKPVPDDSAAKLKLPTHEDIARARAFIEDTWRQLMDMLANMQKDAKSKS
jgi:hypothetical protein